MKKHTHFVGIGGVSMSGLARHCAADGHEVSGCDIKESKLVAKLRNEGIRVDIGQSPNHLLGVERLVYSMAIDKSEPEFIEAKAKGIELLGRIEYLAELFDAHSTIGVTGSHGKSTTTGMIAAIFLANKKDPSIQIGAELNEIDGNWRYGKSKYLIAEVDESNPGFANLKTDTALITNLGNDHIAGEFDERRNYHASQNDLNEAVKSYLGKARQVLYYADCPSLAVLLADVSKSFISYGYSKTADYQIVSHELSPSSSKFELLLPNGKKQKVSLSIPGEHNIQNAAAALAIADIYSLNMEQSVKALKRFKGVGRRWQIWGRPKGALIIDDYAVHQTEITATLTTAKNTARRVRAVLQPHRMVRTAQNWQELAKAVSIADEILVLDIYNFGEREIPGVSSQLIIDYLQNSGKIVSHHSINSATKYLEKSLNENDLIITLGAGDVWKIAENLSRAQKISKIVELKDYTSLKVGGKAELWEVNNTAELILASQAEYKIIGAGSNLLVSDKGVKERVIKLGPNYNNLASWKGETDFWFGASTPLPGLLRKAYQFGLSGIEGLYGIPAQLGGAIKMNAGSKFSEISDVLKQVEIFHNGILKTLNAKDIGLSYRQSNLPKGAIITKALISLKKADKEAIRERISIVDAARKNQPKSKSAGCAFKNPKGLSAGKLIDEAGLKGMRIGDAMVAYEHANFIINMGHASAEEILELLEKVQDSVGYKLEIEWEMWGFK